MKFYSQQIIVAILTSFYIGSAFSNPYTVGSDVPSVTVISPETVEVTDLWPAIKEDNIGLVMNIIHNLALKELRDNLGDSAKIKTAIAQWLKNGGGQQIVNQLNDLVSDPNTSDNDKAIAVMKAIENSFSQYQTEPTGSLNLTVQHSIPFNVTRLNWDNKAHSDICTSYGTYVYSNPDGSLRYVPYYKESTLLQYPDYYIYKTINGTDHLIKKYKGKKVVTDNYTISVADPWGSVVSIYEYNTSDGLTLKNGRRFYDDMYSDLYDQGDSVSYKVVADLSPYKGVDCGSGAQYSSSQVVDSNGDYLVDFIPQHEYASFIAGTNSWILPIITYINN